MKKYIVLIIMLLIIVVGLVVEIFYTTTMNNKSINEDTEEFNTIIESDITNTIENNEKKLTSSEEAEIYNYLHKVWIDQEMYYDNMPEFDNVKDLPSDYLAACAYDSDFTKESYKLSDFNDILINLFGNDVDGLLKETDLKNKFYYEEILKGVYELSGFDGSEITGSCFIVDSIEKDHNKYNVNLLEYKYELENFVTELEPGDETRQRYYNKQNELFLTTTVKCINDDEDDISYEDYDEFGKKINYNYKEIYDDNGNVIDYSNTYILNNYKDKLSVRKLVLIYNDTTKSFNLESSKFETKSNETDFSNNDYSFKYNNNWKVLGNATEQTVGPLNRRLGALQIDVGNNNTISIIKHTNTSLENYVEEHIQNYQNSSGEDGGFELEEDYECSLNNKYSTYKIVFLQNDLYYISYLLEHNNLVYEIEFVGSIDEYYEMKGHIETIVNSFEIK